MPTITFKIKYSTFFGQNLYLTGDSLQLGKNKTGAALKMQYLNKDTWQLSLDIDFGKRKNIKYSYFVINENNELISQEWKERNLSIDEATEGLVIVDTWSSPATLDYTFDTQAFDYLVPTKSGKTKKAIAALTFRISVAMLKEDECVGLLGGHSLLHSWNENEPILLEKTAKIDWQISLEASSLPSYFEYKYIIYNKKTKQLVQWETGEIE